MSTETDARKFSVMKRTRELRSELVTTEERAVKVVKVPGQPEKLFLDEYQARRYANKHARPTAVKEYQRLLEHMVTTVPTMQFKMKYKCTERMYGSWSQRQGTSTKIHEVDLMVRLCCVKSRTNLKYIINKFPRHRYMHWQPTGKPNGIDNQIPVKSIFVIVNSLPVGQGSGDVKNWVGYVHLTEPTYAGLEAAIGKIDDEDFRATNRYSYNALTSSEKETIGYDGKAYRLEPTAKPLIDLWLAKHGAGLYGDSTAVEDAATVTDGKVPASAATSGSADKGTATA